MSTQHQGRSEGAAKARKTQLAGRANAVSQFRQPLKRLRDAMEDIKPVWGRLTPEQRKLVEAKDPVLQLARQMYEELREWFDGV